MFCRFFRNACVKNVIIQCESASRKTVVIILYAFLLHYTAVLYTRTMHYLDVKSIVCIKLLLLLLTTAAAAVCGCIRVSRSRPFYAVVTTDSTLSLSLLYYYYFLVSSSDHNDYYLMFKATAINTIVFIKLAFKKTNEVWFLIVLA